MPGIPWDTESARKLTERLKQQEADPNRDIGSALRAEELQKSAPPPQKKYLNETFFDEQLETLLKKNIREEVITFKWFQRHISQLRKKVHDVGEVKGGHIPVLLIIPRKSMLLSKLLTFLEVDGAPGYTDLEVDKILDIDGFDRGSAPYLVYDVEVGVETFNLSPAECEQKFKAENRLGLLCDEGIALGIHFPKLIEKFSVNLIGTRYKAQFVTALKNSAIGPKLGFNFMDHRNELWGTPSCGGRISL